MKTDSIQIKKSKEVVSLVQKQIDLEDENKEEIKVSNEKISDKTPLNEELKIEMPSQEVKRIEKEETKHIEISNQV